MRETYHNPILFVDYSDPDAIRVGEEYFMTASSFHNTPGLPLLRSRNLVDWELIGYALENLPFPRYDTPQHGCGVWAPAIRYHNGEFLIFFPMPDEGIFVTRARDPEGPWSAPRAIHTAAEGAGWIDPCPFWNEDGRAYLVFALAKSRAGRNNILQIAEMAPDGSALIGEPRIVVEGFASGLTTLEGPKLYRRGAWIYIFAPAGGVKTGGQMVFRARSVWGPYEARCVMDQGASDVNGPHQGAWVEAPDGGGWFLHFQDVYAGGRIVHLQPLSWREDGWPVIGEASAGETCGRPVREWRLPVPDEGAHRPGSQVYGAGANMLQQKEEESGEQRPVPDEGAQRTGSQVLGAGANMLQQKDEESGEQRPVLDEGGHRTGSQVPGARANMLQEKDEESGRQLPLPAEEGVSSVSLAPGADGRLSEELFSLQWQWNANHRPEWRSCRQQATVPSMTEPLRQRTLWLYAQPAARTLSDQPELMLRKWESPCFSAEAVADLSNLRDGDMAGFVHMATVYGALAVRRQGGHFSLVRILGQQIAEGETIHARETEEVAVEELPLAGCEAMVRFLYRVTPEPSVEYNEEGPYRFPIPRWRVELLFAPGEEAYGHAMVLEGTAGRWVGAKEGLFCVSTRGAGGYAVWESFVLKGQAS